MNGAFITENISKRMILYPSPSSSRTMATFQGLGELGNAVMGLSWGCVDFWGFGGCTDGVEIY